MIVESSKTVAFLISRVDCNDGIASHCETLMHGLRTSGWKVVLITGKVGFDNSSVKRFESLKELSEEWIVFDSLNLLSPNFTSISKILSAIRRYKIQFIHAHGYSILSLAFILKMLTGIKCVATCHTFDAHLLKPIYFGKSIEGKNLRLKKMLLHSYLKIFSPQVFIAISSDIEQWLLQDIGIAQQKIKKIFNGIDSKYFHPPNHQERQNARERFRLSTEDFVITLVGRTQWDKGHKLLIDAIKQIAKSSPQYSFKGVFAGSGDQKEEIENYAFIEEEDQHRFLFLGYVNECRDVYWASNIIVLPSPAEGFGLVIVEAMSCGIVPIRTPAGGAYDQIEDGLNGFIIPFDDLDALTSRLLQLAEDTELLSKMVANVLTSSKKKFTLETMTLGTIAAYEEAIK